MSRDTKIMAAVTTLQIVVAAAKSGAKTPDQFLEAAKSELIPIVVNIVGMVIVFKLVK